jgi:drug/metabolite transporter (DMT)-like permease
MRTRPRSGLRATPLGALAVTVPVVGWSFANTIVKIVDVPALSFAFWRLLMGTAVMLVVLAVSRRRMTWAMVRASAPGGVLFGFNLILFFSAIKETSIADVLVIAALQPALILLVAGRLFGERVTRREVGWVLVSVVGVVGFVVVSSGTPVWSLWGDLLALGSVIVWTAYFVVSKRARKQVQAVEYMTTVTLVATLVVTPITLVSGTGVGGLRTADWLWLALFVASAQGGHLLLAWAHRQVDVTVSSLIVLAETPISAVAALVVLGEPLTALQVVAGLVAVAAVGVVVRGATTSGSVEAAEPGPS